jgi:hypothetical protein
MNENRRQILEMLAAGKVTADEAERLIAALEDSPTPTNGVRAENVPTQVRVKAKYLRVLV